MFADAYAEARRQAADEAELAVETFPVECGWTLDTVFGEDGA